MHKPFPPHIFKVARKLKKEYKDFSHNNKKNPLDELVFILCSVKRSEQVYLNAYRTLKRAFPKYAMLADTPVREIRKAVAWGGLQNQKTSAAKAIIKTLIKKFGKPTLAPLKRMSDDECEQFLVSFPGVGKKVARCVMLYSLERQVFPVDSHCWRIANRLGWNKKTFDSNKCSEKDMDYLQELIPPRIRFSLYVNMVSHGRKVCMARYPKCNICTINHYCPQGSLPSQFE
jgi:endonuclease III